MSAPLPGLLPTGSQGPPLPWLQHYLNASSPVIPPYDATASPSNGDTFLAWNPMDTRVWPPSLTDDQHATLLTASMISAAMSIGASLIVVGTFLGWRPFRTPANRLIYFMSLADLCSAVAILIGRWCVTAAPGWCVLQAFLLQWGDLTSVSWTVVMSLNLLFVLFSTRSARDLESLEKYYFFCCVGLPFLAAFLPIPLSIRDPAVPIYGPDMLRCWITSDWAGLRLGLFYGPIWLIFLFNLSVYIAAGIIILERTRNMDYDGPGPHAAVLDHSLPSPGVEGCGGGKDRARTGSSLFLRFPGPDRSSSFLSDFSQSRRLTDYSLDSPSPCPPTQWTQPILLVRSFRTRYFQKIFLFLLAYVAVWLIPSTIRVMEWLHDGSSSTTTTTSSTLQIHSTNGALTAALTVMESTAVQDQSLYFNIMLVQEILTPLRGFLNFLCYFLLGWYSVWSLGRQKSMPPVHGKNQNSGSSNIMDHGTSARSGFLAISIPRDPLGIAPPLPTTPDSP